MKRILILVMAFWLMMTASAFADTHLIVVSQNQDTEAEVMVNGESEMVDFCAGMNCMTYDADEEPQIEITAYGDTYRPMAVKGNDGDWYALMMVGAPEVECE